MKKINQNFHTLFFFFFSIIALAQTDGISYQAVIYSPGATELPGYDSQNDVLANHRVSFEFTITGLNNIKIYQETQTTTSDSNGLVNLVIGKGTPTDAPLIPFPPSTNSALVALAIVASYTC